MPSRDKGSPDQLRTSDPAFIGARIRELRIASGFSLTSVATSVGISASALSQIETGALQPSVNRLIEIVGELNVPLAAVFEQHTVLISPSIDDEVKSREVFESVLVATPRDISSVILGEGVVYRRLSPVAVDGVEMFESVYPPGSSSSLDGSMLVHNGFEIGNVMAGELTFEFEEGGITLKKGGSISFPAEKPHRVVNQSREAAASAVWITIRQ